MQTSSNWQLSLVWKVLGTEIELSALEACLMVMILWVRPKYEPILFFTLPVQFCPGKREGHMA